MHLLQPIKMQFMLRLFRMFGTFDNKAKYMCPVAMKCCWVIQGGGFSNEPFSPPKFDVNFSFDIFELNSLKADIEMALL